MQLQPEDIQKYKEIYKKEFGEEITDAEAEEQGRNLVEFFRLLIDIDRGKKK